MWGWMGGGSALPAPCPLGADIEVRVRRGPVAPTQGKAASPPRRLLRFFTLLSPFSDRSQNSWMAVWATERVTALQQASASGLGSAGFGRGLR